MPIEKLRKIFKMVIWAHKKQTLKKTHDKYGFILKRGSTYEYIFLDIPSGYTFDNIELRQSAYIVEYHKISDDFSEGDIKKRVQLLNRRQNRNLKKIKKA